MVTGRYSCRHGDREVQLYARQRDTAPYDGREVQRDIALYDGREVQRDIAPCDRTEVQRDIALYDGREVLTYL